MKHLDTRSAVSLFLLATLLCVPSLYAGSLEDSTKVGTVQITVLDENGTPVEDAPVYIYGEQKTRFVGGKDIPGSMTFIMPPGVYRISSAIAKKTGDDVDRFASHEAHIQVTAGDNQSVILTLLPVNPTVAALSYAQLYGTNNPAFNQ